MTPAVAITAGALVAPNGARRARWVPPARTSSAPLTGQLLFSAGLPARYRHPETGAPYATAAAFAELESNGGHPYGPPPIPVAGDRKTCIPHASEQVTEVFLLLEATKSRQHPER